MRSKPIKVAAKRRADGVIEISTRPKLCLSCGHSEGAHIVASMVKKRCCEQCRGWEAA